MRDPDWRLIEGIERDIQHDISPWLEANSIMGGDPPGMALEHLRTLLTLVKERVPNDPKVHMQASMAGPEAREGPKGPQPNNQTGSMEMFGVWDREIAMDRGFHKKCIHGKRLGACSDCYKKELKDKELST